MNRIRSGTRTIATAMALMMGVATLASAQPRDDRRGGPPEHERMAPQPPRGGPQFERGRDRGPGGGPEHEWHRGDRLPNDYRGRQYVIDDWRSHRLQPPPRGYHWVQAGADFALVAITTGIITQLIVNGQY